MQGNAASFDLNYDRAQICKQQQETTQTFKESLLSQLCQGSPQKKGHIMLGSTQAKLSTHKEIDGYQQYVACFTEAQAWNHPLKERKQKESGAESFMRSFKSKIDKMIAKKEETQVQTIGKDFIVKQNYVKLFKEKSQLAEVEDPRVQYFLKC